MENENITKLFDGLTPIANDGGLVFVVNNTGGMLFPTVVEAVRPGDAGGPRTLRSQPVGIYPGLDRVPKGWADRLKADAKRQNDRNGGVLAELLDARKLEFIDIDKAAPALVGELLARSANIELVGELRGHKRHGEAAERAFKAWHSREASNDTKLLRHFWAMRTGSRKVA